ncbi:hypothetical protein VSH64_29460 [Amycolatopsis rhabdoformis]|uniref:EcsC family protein n=1 Tax=Amycolatopsis rhabdoformis TaxID=1448059 RepID=A0ABZ1I017_9PSEU|nr:hypothetical protein [Amycolatopsis rhabdoformis]WSE26989.1 hypothetical protein VSH64_29460 [Amycolatopsis rhabdoformis]
MADPISDGQVVAVLRPFVRACAPMIDALREADPFGLRGRARKAGGADEFGDDGFKEKVLGALTSVKVPGTAAWAAMDIDQRAGWWVNRVGRLTSVLTSIPGLGGALADRLPVQDTLGAASQGLLLCAIAGEYGVTDVGSRVRLIASVLFDRDITPALAAGKPADESAEDSAAARLTEELTESERAHGKVTVKAVAGTLWRLGRSLWGITEELEKRPRGRFYHRALGMVPVVGAAGDYLGERWGLKRAWKRAHEWLMANSHWASLS